MKAKSRPAFRVLHASSVLFAAVVFVTLPLHAPAQTVWSNALSFDGVNDYVVVTNFGFAVPTNEVTVEFWQWARKAKIQCTFALSNGDSTNRFQAHIPWVDGKVYWDFGNIITSGRLVYTPPEPLTSSWHHFALVAKTGPNAFMAIYRNGVLEAYTNSASTFVPSLCDLRFGLVDPWIFEGELDDFRIWNVARTAEQIREGMSHPLSGTEPNLVVYYRFDEVTGTVVHDAGSNGFHGTVNGASWTNVPSFVNMPTQLTGVRDGSSGRWGDFNNDGWLDVLLSGDNYWAGGKLSQVWRNNGNGTFTDIQAGLPGAYYGTTDWGDYDNDGFLDILITGYTAPGGFVEVWRKTGTGFTKVDTGMRVGGMPSAAWGDYDNDGRLDILLTGGGDSGPIAQIWRNTGNGFIRVNTGLTGVMDGFGVWGDYDNDGRLDVLLAGYMGSGYVTELWRNTGGSFTKITSGFPGVCQGSGAWGDFDNDGRLDLLLTGWDNRTTQYAQVWRNTGTGFTMYAELPGVRGSSGVWGDYDNDGQLDILLTGYPWTGAIVADVWRNTGAGFTRLNIGIPGAGMGSAAWGDYDNDGRLDILVTGNLVDNRPTAQLWRNISRGLNAPPTAPSGLTVIPVGNETILTWNQAADEQTPANGLTYNVALGSVPGVWNLGHPQASLTDGRRRVPKPGNAQQGLTALVANLPEGDYYWGVQAVDGAFAGSPFALEGRFGVYRPAVTTLLATNISPTGATMHGTVNPRERETFAWFEYGLTTKYGSATTPVNLGNGQVLVDLSSAAAGLLPWLTYHYRAVGSNGVGRAEGADRTFTLPGPALSAPSISALPDVSIPQGSSTAVMFSVSDPDTPVEQLAIQARANNPVLLPTLAVGGGSTARVLTLVPDANHSGSAVVTVTASDGTSTTSETFTLTVTNSADYRSSLLYLTNAQVVSTEAWRFHLADAGTGSTNYMVEYRPDFSPTNAWIRATNVSHLGGGVFEVDTGPPESGIGFYRVKGSRLLSAGLGAADLTVEEGAGPVGPVLVFNGPYSGTVSYTWTSSSGTSNGTVVVNGTTAVIPVPITDNSRIDPLRTLTLRLQPGAGYTLASVTQGNVTIAENDADWQGTLVIPNGLANTTTASLTNGPGGFTNVLLPQNANMLIGFTLRIQQSNGNFQGQMQSDGFGFFPTNSLAQLTVTENSFCAVATNVPLPTLAGSPLFDAPHRLDLRLDAVNAPGQTNVLPTQISGTATMVSVVPGRPYLDSAIPGTFLLLKPPVIPSTNEVPLYPAR